MAKPPKVVRAERFELVDSEGRVRAVLGLETDGKAVLNLFDKKGRNVGGVAERTYRFD